MTRTLYITWVKQGTIQWEKWYTERYGNKLQKLPSMDDHISFANFDLKNNQCSTIKKQADNLVIQDIPEEKLRLAVSIIAYHGFSILDIK